MRRPEIDFVSSSEKKSSLKILIASLFRRRRDACHRLHFLDLDDRMLRDIGITRHELLHGVDFRPEAGQERE